MQDGQQHLEETCAEPLIDRWLQGSATDVGQHSVMILSEGLGTRVCLAAELHDTFRDHYMSQETWSKRLEDLGAPETAEILKELLPNTKQARSGDAGEILATEVAEEKLHYQVPIRRLRWKDGRETALRGDDIVGVARDSQGRLRFLKGESKSRVALSPSTINDASKALDGDMGRPTRHAVLFIATRLRELGKDDFATELEKALLVLQRRFKEGCAGRHEVRRGAWHGSAWPVRYYPASLPATAATQPARTVPWAAIPAPPGRPAAS